MTTLRLALVRQCSALALVVCAASSAHAQSDPGDEAAPQARDELLAPLTLGGLQLGGYVQPTFEYTEDTEFNEDDYDGFAFRNARLTASGDFGVHPELAAGGGVELELGDGGVSLLDVFASLSWRDDLLAVDLGQFKTPFSLLELTSESSVQFPLARGGEVTPRRLLLGRDRGLQLRSAFTPGDAWIEARLGVFNGQGANSLKNFDSEFLWAGRLEVHPLGRVSPGEPDLDHSDFGVAGGFSSSYTARNGNNVFGLDTVGAEQLRFGGDLRMKFRGLSLRGEYLSTSTRPEGEDEVGAWAAYAQIGYVLPQPSWPQLELVFRWSRVDLDGSSEGYTSATSNPETGEPGEFLVFTDFDRTLHQRLEFGTNLYLLEHRAKVGVVYRRTDLLEGARTDTNGDPLFGDAVFVTMQVGWL